MRPPGDSIRTRLEPAPPRTGALMQIELTGTNVEITDTLRELVGKRLD